MSRQTAVETQQTNVIGTLNLLFSIRDHVPDCHLIKLGTMGEYGTPNIDIEEGFIEIEHNGRKRHAALSEAARFALSLLQGPRFDQHPFRLPDLGPAGHRPQPGRRLRDRDRRDGPRRAPGDPLRLRRDLRHRAQPLLRAGGDRSPADRLRSGGQTRGYLNIRDTLRCVELAMENPAAAGEFRVFNQFTEQFSVSRAGDTGQECGAKVGFEVEIRAIRTPGSSWSTTTTTRPTRSCSTSVSSRPTSGRSWCSRCCDRIELHRDRVIPEAIEPRTKWNPVAELGGGAPAGGRPARGSALRPKHPARQARRRCYHRLFR